MKIEIKKIFLPIVLLAASASFTLTGQSCSMPKGNTQPDTIVCSEIVGPKNEEWKRTEFFVVTKNDTSAFSFIIETRENKVGWIEFGLFPAQKDFQYINGSSNDTTAFRISDSRNHEYHIPNYKELIHEMDLCLGAASKVYDFSTKYSMHCFLSTFGDIAVMTTNLLNANCKLNEHGYYWHSDMTKELAKTPLAEDLSIMLKKYNRRVKRISCQEGLVSVPKEAMLDNNISKDLSIPDKVWEVSLYIKLEPLQQK